MAKTDDGGLAKYFFSACPFCNDSHSGSFREEVDAQIMSCRARALTAATHEVMAVLEKVSQEGTSRKIPFAGRQFWIIAKAKGFLEVYPESDPEVRLRGGTVEVALSIQRFVRNYAHSTPSAASSH